MAKLKNIMNLVQSERPFLPFQFKCKFYIDDEFFETVTSSVSVNLPKVSTDESSIWMGNGVILQPILDMSDYSLDITLEETNTMRCLHFVDNLLSKFHGLPWVVPIGVFEYGFQFGRVVKKTLYYCILSSYTEPNFSNSGGASIVTLSLHFRIMAVTPNFVETDEIKSFSLKTINTSRSDFADMMNMQRQIVKTYTGRTFNNEQIETKFTNRQKLEAVYRLRSIAYRLKKEGIITDADTFITRGKAQLLRIGPIGENDMFIKDVTNDNVYDFNDVTKLLDNIEVTAALAIQNNWALKAQFGDDYQLEAKAGWGSFIGKHSNENSDHYKGLAVDTQVKKKVGDKYVYIDFLNYLNDGATIVSEKTGMQKIGKAWDKKEKSKELYDYQQEFAKFTNTDDDRAQKFQETMSNSGTDWFHNGYKESQINTFRTNNKEFLEELFGTYTGPAKPYNGGSASGMGGTDWIELIEAKFEEAKKSDKKKATDFVNNTDNNNKIAERKKKLQSDWKTRKQNKGDNK